MSALPNTRAQRLDGHVATNVYTDTRWHAHPPEQSYSGMAAAKQFVFQKSTVSKNSRKLRSDATATASFSSRYAERGALDS